MFGWMVLLHRFPDEYVPECEKSKHAPTMGRQTKIEEDCNI